MKSPGQPLPDAGEMPPAASASAPGGRSPSGRSASASLLHPALHFAGFPLDLASRFLYASFQFEAFAASRLSDCLFRSALGLSHETARLIFGACFHQILYTYHIPTGLGVMTWGVYTAGFSKP